MTNKKGIKNGRQRERERDLTTVGVIVILSTYILTVLISTSISTHLVFNLINFWFGNEIINIELLSINTCRENGQEL